MDGEGLGDLVAGRGLPVDGLVGRLGDVVAAGVELPLTVAGGGHGHALEVEGVGGVAGRAVGEDRRLVLHQRAAQLGVEGEPDRGPAAGEGTEAGDAPLELSPPLEHPVLDGHGAVGVRHRRQDRGEHDHGDGEQAARGPEVDADVGAEPDHPPRRRAQRPPVAGPEEKEADHHAVADDVAVLPIGVVEGVRGDHGRPRDQGQQRLAPAHQAPGEPGGGDPEEPGDLGVDEAEVVEAVTEEDVVRPAAERLEQAGHAGVEGGTAEGEQRRHRRGEDGHAEHRPDSQEGQHPEAADQDHGDDGDGDDRVQPGHPARGHRRGADDDGGEHPQAEAGQLLQERPPLRHGALPPGGRGTG